MRALVEGLRVTMQIFTLTLVLAIPLGIGVAILSKNTLVKGYVLLMRGTPLLLQIICVYFAPYYLFKVSYDRFVAVIFAFTINYAAYFAEIFRGGNLAIPKGQQEAAFTLGFNKAKTFFFILLPQIIKRVLPSLSNEVITLVRDTSLSQVIGITEMFSLAQKQASFEFSMKPLFLAGGIYLLITYLLTKGFHFVEKKLEYYS